MDEMKDCLHCPYWGGCAGSKEDLPEAADVIEKLASILAADVVERKTGKNVATEYDDCDQFVCSECGIELQDWRRVEHDEDGLEVYHEYRLRFCPNCGAKMEVPTDV